MTMESTKIEGTVTLQRYRKPKSYLRQTIEWSLVWIFFFVMWGGVFFIFAYDGYAKFGLPIPWFFITMGAVILACDLWLMIFITRQLLRKRRNWVYKSREEIEEEKSKQLNE